VLKSEKETGFRLGFKGWGWGEDWGWEEYWGCDDLHPRLGPRVANERAPGLKHQKTERGRKNLLGQNRRHENLIWKGAKPGGPSLPATCAIVGNLRQRANTRDSNRERTEGCGTQNNQTAGEAADAKFSTAAKFATVAKLATVANRNGKAELEKNQTWMTPNDDCRKRFRLCSEL
jgi:hypothetical protein